MWLYLFQNFNFIGNCCVDFLDTSFSNANLGSKSSKNFFPKLSFRKVLLSLLFLLAYLTIPEEIFAQSVNVNIGEGPGVTSRIVQMIGMVTILSLAPSILVMVTSFTRIIVVFSFLKSALGLQQTPPNAVIVSLSLFLTAFIMAPTFEKIYTDAVEPLVAERITEKEALTRFLPPIEKFMHKQVRKKDLELFLNLTNANPNKTSYENVPIYVLTPAFMISELRRAFEIGFLIFIPFIIIDLLVASILMAMGMMMVPPVMISLPFKVVFFVIVDGWYMICGSLIKSFAN